MLILITCQFSRIVKSQTCFDNQFPHFISGDDDIKWQSSITNNATNLLYLGGLSYSFTAFPGTSTTTPIAIAAQYSLLNQNYVWIKGYQSSSGIASEVASLAINRAEDTLAMAVNYGTSYQIFLIDPQTGIEKYKFFIVSSPSIYGIYQMQNQQMIFAGQSRLYLTVWTNCPSNSCYQYSQEFFFTAFDYSSGTVLFEKYANKDLNSNTYGYAQIGAMLDITSSPTLNGQEIILLGTGISFVLEQWYLGILSYNAQTDVLSGYNFDYNSGQYYNGGGLITPSSYQFINIMLRVNSTIYAASKQNYWYYPDNNTNTLSNITYSDSSFQSLTEAKVYSLSYGYGDYYLMILSLQYFNNQIHALGVMTYSSSTNEETIYFTVDFTSQTVKAISIYYKLTVNQAVFTNPTITNTISVGGTSFTILQGYYVGSQKQFTTQTTLKALSSTYEAATIASSLPSETCSSEQQILLSNWTLKLNSAQTSNYSSSLAFQTLYSNTAAVSSTFSHFDYDLNQGTIDDLCTLNGYKSVVASPVTFADQNVQLGQQISLSCQLQTSTLTPSCSDSNWLYSITTTTLATNIGDFVTIDKTSNNLQIQAKNIYGVNLSSGSYQIIVKQTQASGLSISFSFTLQVGSNFPIATQCNVFCINSTETQIIVAASVQPQVQSYKITSPSQSIIIQAFQVTSSYCNSSDIVYTMQVTPQIISQSVSFISFNSTDLTVSWFSNSNQDSGIFNITVYGTVTTILSHFTGNLTFLLNVTKQLCPNSTETLVQISSNENNIQAQTYQVSQSIKSLAIQPFSASSLYCDSNDIVYSMVVTPTTLGQSASFISFNQQLILVQWQSSSNTDVGLFIINVIGTITTATKNFNASQSFSLTVTPQPCTQNSTINLECFILPIIKNKTYTVSNPTLVINFDPFKLQDSSQAYFYPVQNSFAYLTTQNLQFPLDFSLLNNLPSWIQFTGYQDSSGQFLIQTNSTQYTGIYQIVVVTQFTNLGNAFQTFWITIKNQTFYLPFFTENLQSSYNISCGDQITLPIYQDPQQSFVTAVIDFKTAHDFMSANVTLNPLLIQCSKTCQNGEYIVSILLIDQLGQSANFNFLVIITQPVQKNNKSQTDKNKQQQIYAQLYGFQPPIRNSSQSKNLIDQKNAVEIQSISSTGLVTIVFSQKIKVPNINQTSKQSNRMLLLENLNDFLNPNVMEVKITQGYDRSSITVNWTAIQLQSTQMQIQLIFRNPLDISSIVMDQLQVNFLDQDKFILENGNGYLFNKKSDLNTQQLIPPQFKSQEEALIAQQQIQTLQGGSYSTIVITLIIQLIGKKLIGSVWLFFCAIQLIIFLNVSINFLMPASSQMAIQALSDIISLNAIDKKQVAQQMSIQQIQESPLFQNLGGIAFLAILLIFMVLLIVLFVKMCKHPKIKGVMMKIKNMLFWNFLIRYFYASYLNFCYSSLTSILNFQTAIQEKVISCTIMIVLIGVNILFIWLICKYEQGYLDHPIIKAKISMLYAGIQTDQYKKKLYPQLFFLQRFLLVLVMVLKFSFGLQAVLIQIVQITYFQYLLFVGPYTTINEAFPDILNEIFLVLMQILQLCVSPWQTDSLIRYQIGKGYFVLVSLFFILNFGIIFLRIGLPLNRKFKLKRMKKIKNRQKLEALNLRNELRKKRFKLLIILSGRVQTQLIDDIESPLPHISQINLDKIKSRRVLFNQIANLELERNFSINSKTQQQNNKKYDVNNYYPQPRLQNQQIKVPQAEIDNFIQNRTKKITDNKQNYPRLNQKSQIQNSHQGNDNKILIVENFEHIETQNLNNQKKFNLMKAPNEEIFQQSNIQQVNQKNQQNFDELFKNTFQLKRQNNQQNIEEINGQYKTQINHQKNFSFQNEIMNTNVDIQSPKYQQQSYNISDSEKKLFELDWGKDVQQR